MSQSQRAEPFYTRASDGTLVNRSVHGHGLRISTAVREVVVNERRSLLVRDARVEDQFGLRESIVARISAAF
jgi:hypothetical protein